MKELKDDYWTEEIAPTGSLFDLKLKEVWKYRDLILLFVKRDFVAQYKQTILGPLWHFIVPFITTVLYVIVFGNIMNVTTNGTHPFLFYLVSTLSWSFFAKCLQGTAVTFSANQGIFGKVYFPRLVTPISTVFSALLGFGISLTLLIVSIAYFYFFTDEKIVLSIWVLALPIIMFISGTLALGLGIMISSLTSKYRDLTIFIGFGVQLLMFFSAVLYPLSQIPTQYAWAAKYNPLVTMMEGYRMAFLGVGSITVMDIVYLGILSIIVFIIGIILFNKTERTFMDTV
ncbi:ABC transporter permease [Bernardetia sp. ABR2-2B]|uniref:ABC transporter permease n=1 Tax=Bernardetia sp. ABR2-2B TaxID=3127472 RepID=UPI0030CF60FB